MAVRRTRLQVEQNWWVMALMKPIFPGSPPGGKYRQGPPPLSPLAGARARGLLQPGAQIRLGDAGHTAAQADGHQLNEAHRQRAVPGQLGQGDPLGGVFQGGDAVELDCQAGVSSAAFSPESGGETAAPGNGGELDGVQGVQADVHPVQAGGHEAGGLLPQRKFAVW